MIEIEHGLLRHPEKLKAYGSTFAVLTDENVKQSYAAPLAKILDAPLFCFPAGEASKTREMKHKIEDAMLKKGLGRNTSLIVIGGGVAMDLGGFIAATYCRGLPLFLIPTSLLAMVDAAIGGKNGLNVPEGKNLIGTFYPPKKVFIDPETLKTLPKNELRNGFAEMIKHGLVQDAAYFEQLEKGESLDILIRGSCRIKTKIVEEDPYEKGKRHLLNFGHTVGHALETFTNYTLPHGEAVALGLIIEGTLSLKDTSRIAKLLTQYDLPLKMPPKCTPRALIDIMKMDKKSRNGVPRFVMLQDIGHPHTFDGAYCSSVPEKRLLEALDAFCRS